MNPADYGNGVVRSPGDSSPDPIRLSGVERPQLSNDDGNIRDSHLLHPPLSGDPPSRASAGQVNPSDYVLAVIRQVSLSAFVRQLPDEGGIPGLDTALAARNDRALPAALGLHIAPSQ